MIRSFCLMTIIICLNASCSNKKKELGTIQTQEGVKVSFKISNKLESVNSVYYSLEDSNDSVILSDFRLLSVESRDVKLKNFKVKHFNEMLYITFVDTNVVYAIYDFDTKKGYPNPIDGDWSYVAEQRNLLLEKIKMANPKLEACWER